jgi:hypothetical protein
LRREAGDRIEKRRGGPKTAAEKDGRCHSDEKDGRDEPVDIWRKKWKTATCAGACVRVQVSPMGALPARRKIAFPHVRVPSPVRPCAPVFPNRTRPQQIPDVRCLTVRAYRQGFSLPLSLTLCLVS